MARFGRFCVIGLVGIIDLSYSAMDLWRGAMAMLALVLSDWFLDMTGMFSLAMADWVVRF